MFVPLRLLSTPHVIVIVIYKHHVSFAAPAVSAVPAHAQTHIIEVIHTIAKTTPPSWPSLPILGFDCIFYTLVLILTVEFQLLEEHILLLLGEISTCNPTLETVHLAQDLMELLIPEVFRTFPVWAFRFNGVDALVDVHSLPIMPARTILILVRLLTHPKVLLTLASPLCAAPILTVLNFSLLSFLQRNEDGLRILLALQRRRRSSCS
mmetsp:Transcript_40308/g.92699  ORF Transcript_40308/g.92699 Transcript_40308/m.92699 type:complete len:208 (+) Transcript_40308:251-874(+)